MKISSKILLVGSFVFWAMQLEAQKVIKDRITILSPERDLNDGNLQDFNFQKFENIQDSPIYSARVEPTVIRKGIDSFCLKIGVTSNISSLSLSNNGIFLNKGLQEKYIKLYDDGTRGDKIAGDKIFSVDNITVTFDPIVPEGKPIFTVFTAFDSAAIVFNDGRKEKKFVNLMLAYGFIEPSIIPTPKVKILAQNIRKTDFCLNIISEASPPNYNIDLQQISNLYYSQFADNKDFLFVTDLFVRSPYSIAGYFYSTRNNIQGIGQPVYDNTSAYGSSGVLQGFVHSLSSMNAGLLDHELLHRWAAFLDPTLGLTNGAHWNAIKRPTSGFGPTWGAYNLFEYLSGKSYRALLNDEKTFGFYNDLEMYLMGLCDVSEVSTPIETLVNAVDKGYSYDQQTQRSYKLFDADNIRSLKTSEIIQTMGERVPNNISSQKKFSSALVVVYDRPLTEAEFAYYDYFMREYEKSNSTSLTAPTFQAATGGRATMSTRISGEVNTYIPNKPILVSPSSDATNVSISPTFSWSASTGAETYNLQISTSPTFASMIINDSTIVGTTKLIGPLANNTTFFWRVRAMNSIGNSPFSKANNLKTIESIPFTPTIIYPLNGASDQPINLTLQWNGDPKANSYRIQVSTSQDFSSLFIDDSTYTASLKSIGPLRYNTTYYWRVSAKNSAGVSSFSLSSNFKTISNNIPLAISGADQTVKEGENVILDGSKSYDPDGNSINFIWTIPSIITLSSTTVAKLTFIAPEVKKDSVLHFSLIVNDGSDNSVPSNVKVNVQNVIKYTI